MEHIDLQKAAATKAIEVLGGPTEAARLLNVKNHSYQTVQSWLKNRVPAEYCPRVERHTRRLGNVVTCEELRPDVDWAYLREQASPEPRESEFQTSQPGALQD